MAIHGGRPGAAARIGGKTLKGGLKFGRDAIAAEQNLQMTDQVNDLQTLLLQNPTDQELLGLTSGGPHFTHKNLDLQNLTTAATMGCY
jgi:hypothetical protein